VFIVLNCGATAAFSSVYVFFNWLRPPNQSLISVTLQLQDTSIFNSIPSEVGLLTNLEFIDMRSASITGSLPTELGKLTRLTHLDLAANLELNPLLSSEIGLMTSLGKLCRVGVHMKRINLEKHMLISRLCTERIDLSGAGGVVGATTKVVSEIGLLTNLGE
jgi:Leucine-rich repeat (LRR) protein